MSSIFFCYSFALWGTGMPQMSTSHLHLTPLLRLSAGTQNILRGKTSNWGCGKVLPSRLKMQQLSPFTLQQKANVAGTHTADCGLSELPFLRCSCVQLTSVFLVEWRMAFWNFILVKMDKEAWKGSAKLWVWTWGKLRNWFLEAVSWGRRTSVWPVLRSFSLVLRNSLLI